ncbi:nitroreductase [Undibacterium sp. TJN25]|uniref:nitroreductase n=1 Tax=Undibacterium sp. TJN25 TaxID=3413056 RepID=UPI003BF2D431
MDSFLLFDDPELAEGGQKESHLRDAVDSVMHGRKAVRSFLKKPVEKKLVAEILEIARTAPSNSNTQPWRIYALAGEPKEALSKALCEAHSNRPDEYTACYKHFPDVLGEKFLARQNNYAETYYRCLGIERSDQAARAAQTGQNFLFFGAPIGFIFTIENTLERGSWLDYGMFLQSIMLAAKARGLDTCPQISFVKYHEIIRKNLPIPNNEIVVCGMSLGYADPAKRVNSLSLPREQIESFTSFFGFEQ